MESSSSSSSSSVQNVVVMRHGDRLDAAEPLWSLTAARPWDPPLTEAGKIRAWTTGKRLRGVGFPIHRVVVSPFLRCRQTAREVVVALCSVVADEGLLLSMETSADAPAIDPSKVKVHIEYGICEVLNSQAMRIDGPAKQGNWFPDVSELEALFPDGTVDHSAGRIYEKMPLWEEPTSVARSRYEDVITALADKFPHENLLLVTHGEAVGVSVSSFTEDTGIEVFNVEYCAFSLLQRTISSTSSLAVAAGKFKMLTENAKSGVYYYSDEDQTETNALPPN
ncbi:uncharacterized protein M6B38_259695 [Iris pallida]|uniref:Uncharacterized protein n=1 Tax=Iris pallida TaxID=29817 RepID=A0AAX6IFJ5_IRIPA|nr:uncharacterized protein M6B38_259695 [Iris pallida]